MGNTIPKMSSGSQVAVNLSDTAYTPPSLWFTSSPNTGFITKTLKWSHRRTLSTKQTSSAFCWGNQQDLMSNVHIMRYHRVASHCVLLFPVALCDLFLLCSISVMEPPAWFSLSRSPSCQLLNSAGGVITQYAHETAAGKCARAAGWPRLDTSSAFNPWLEISLQGSLSLVRHSPNHWLLPQIVSNYRCSRWPSCVVVMNQGHSSLLERLQCGRGSWRQTWGNCRHCVVLMKLLQLLLPCSERVCRRKWRRLLSAWIKLRAYGVESKWPLLPSRFNTHKESVFGVVGARDARFITACDISTKKLPMVSICRITILTINYWCLNNIWHAVS